jgi:UDP-N-acetylglucosamine--N-acetylmuramyl-(pentapeptide) pyrophosphoryl-undecaprenol N-acetylglucosamine transferase
MQVFRGMQASLKILNGFKPDVLFFTGGYVAFPMAVMGWRRKSVLFVPDIEPGMALKAISRFADRIAVTAEASKKFFSRQGRVIETGYPVRPELSGWTREAAQAKFGLNPGLPTLLVFGGSKGSRSINSAVLAHLPALLEKVQVIHISGENDWQTVSARQKELTTNVDRYHAFPYLHEEMGAAMAAADLVVSRAGASALGEFPLFGLPAILVPYPHAWRYQKVNADYLVQRGAATMLKDDRLMDELYSTVVSMLNNPGKLNLMRQSMRELSRPQAAQSIASLLAEMAGA